MTTRAECEETVALMKKKRKTTLLDDDEVEEFCSRGLEGRTQARRRPLSKNQAESSVIVNYEKTRQ
jgi:hypothetical protein